MSHLDIFPTRDRTGKIQNCMALLSGASSSASDVGHDGG